MMKTKILGVVVMTAMTLIFASLIQVEDASAAPDGLSADARKELAQARRATAKYHNIDTAYADGYFDTGFILPGVGCHLLNLGYFGDGTFNPSQPEFLVYANCEAGQGGKAELRSLEYATICTNPECTDPPEGFAGDQDVWEPGMSPAGPIHTLHAWVWRNNPNGIFVKLNPRITD